MKEIEYSPAMERYAKAQSAFINAHHASKRAYAHEEKCRRAFSEARDALREEQRMLLRDDVRRVEVEDAVIIGREIETYEDTSNRESGSAEVLRESFTLGRLFTVGSVREMWGRLKPKGA